MNYTQFEIHRLSEKRGRQSGSGGHGLYRVVCGSDEDGPQDRPCDAKASRKEASL